MNFEGLNATSKFSLNSTCSIEALAKSMKLSKKLITQKTQI